jgi:glycosyltransferase involved in cell wall biosynthesis
MSLRVFAVAQFLPRPDRSAGDRRFVALLAMIARNHAIDLWVEFDSADLTLEDIEGYQQTLKAAGVKLLGLGRKPFVLALARTHYDVGFFEFYFTAERNGDEFRRRQPGAKVIIDSVDVHFARESSGVEFGMGEMAQVDETRRSELAAYRAADAVIVVSDDDENILRDQGDMSPLFLLPIVMPVHERTIKPRPPEIVFVGGFSHLPNLDAMKWFVYAIWPRVHQAAPQARLTIIGSNIPAEVTAFGAIPGIEVVGFVADTSSYLDRAAISIAPLRYGAGMKGKVVEAMSHGLPVVTTSVGAQGLNAVSGEHLLIADDTDEFARALTILLNDPERCRQLGLAGQIHIAGICSPEHVGLALERMLKAVVRHGRSIENWLRWRFFHSLLALRVVARRLALVR